MRAQIESLTAENEGLRSKCEAYAPLEEQYERLTREKEAVAASEKALRQQLDEQLQKEQALETRLATVLADEQEAKDQVEAIRADQERYKASLEESFELKQRELASEYDGKREAGEEAVEEALAGAKAHADEAIEQVRSPAAILRNACGWFVMVDGGDLCARAGR